MNAASPTDILLIRHGETDWNAEKRLQGHEDIALNARGRQQAAALAEALAREPLDAVVSSDLVRAFDTAAALARPHRLPVEVDPALRERCFGAFEGHCHEEIEQRFPDAFAAWKARHPHAAFPAGRRAAETLAGFHARVTQAIDRLAARHAGKRIAVVTHGGVIDSLYRHATATDLQAERVVEIVNTGVHRLRYQSSSLQLVAWGDTAHLTSKARNEDMA